MVNSNKSLWLITRVRNQNSSKRFTLFLGKYVVLFFYPLDFTFVCPTEIIAFSEGVEKFRKIGCEVIAASTGKSLHFTLILSMTSILLPPVQQLSG